MNKTMIKQLIYRDFKAYKTSILVLSAFILVFSMFITFINTNTLGIFSSGIGNIIMIILGVFAAEQSNSVVRMHTASLPVTRREIVFARFLSSSIIVLANTLLHFIVFNLTTATLHQEPVYTSISLLVFACFYGIFQLALYYFVFYRINLIISVIIFVMPAMLWTTLSPGAGFLNDYIPGNNGYLMLFSLATLFIVWLSFFTTVNYYRKKDL
ncbi:ABC-2 transporter permease [Ekhidna sp.]|uniref:ABC-2 transporter permease n=1 Tax=Ekhidna sp. TaxID=2608089 RepID=UPI0032997B14